MNTNSKNNNRLALLLFIIDHGLQLTSDSRVRFNYSAYCVNLVEYLILPKLKLTFFVTHVYINLLIWAKYDLKKILTEGEFIGYVTFTRNYEI